MNQSVGRCRWFDKAKAKRKLRSTQRSRVPSDSLLLLKSFCDARRESAFIRNAYNLAGGFSCSLLSVSRRTRLYTYNARSEAIFFSIKITASGPRRIIVSQNIRLAQGVLLQSVSTCPASAISAFSRF